MALFSSRALRVLIGLNLTVSARIMVMVRRRPYTLIYARGVTKHLKSVDAKYDSLIREKIEEQLLFEPDVETKNRKPLRQPEPFSAQWEIRFGPENRCRVLYDIDKDHHTVEIVAIGEKEGNRLIVGGAEIEL